MRPRKHATWWPFHWRPHKWRRTELPEDLRATMALHADERVLSYGHATDGRAVAATNRGLWLQESDGMHIVEWSHIATLSAHRKLLQFSYLSEDLNDQRVVALELSDPGEVVEAAWDQMADYTLTSVKVPLQGDAGVRVVGRTSPFTNEVTWGLVPDRDLDVSDPEVQMRATEALFEVRLESEA